MNKNVKSFYIDHKSAYNLDDMVVEVNLKPIGRRTYSDYDILTVDRAISKRYISRLEAEQQLEELRKDVVGLPIVTKPHRQYRTPSTDYIEDLAQGYNFDMNVNVELIQNLANLFSYPEEEIEDAFIEVEGGEEVTDFLKNLDYTKFDGGTPLKKALSINAAIVGLVKQEREEEDSTEEEAEKGGKEKKISANMKEATNNFILQKDEEGGDIEKCIVLEEFQKRLGKLLPKDEFLTKNLTLNCDLSAVNALTLSKENAEILKDLSLFNDIKGLESKKKVTEFYDPTSNRRKERFIESYEELMKIPMIEFALPNFKKKLAGKEILYRKPFTAEVQKQSLIFIVDDSGSMSGKFKIGKVKGLLLNRLEQVAKGNAELYITTYESDIHEDNWHYISTEEDCKYIWENFGKIFHFNKGGTNIQRAIESTETTFKKNTLVTRNKSIVPIDKYNPHICIICDGDDHVDATYKPKDYVLHNFVLGNQHDQLQRISSETGGIYQLFTC